MSRHSKKSVSASEITSNSSTRALRLLRRQQNKQFLENESTPDDSTSAFDTLQKRERDAVAVTVSAARKKQRTTADPAVDTVKPHQIAFSPAITTDILHRSTEISSLPKGVVDIWKKTRLNPGMPSSTCNLRVSFNETDPILAEQYLLTYGKDYLQHLRDSETKQWRRMIQRILQSHDCDDNDVDTELETDGDSSHTPTTIHTQEDPFHLPNTHTRSFSADDVALNHTPLSGEVAPLWRRLRRMSSLQEPDDSTVPLPCQPHVTPKMRRTLVSWLTEVMEEYKVSSNAFHLAITLLDDLFTMGPKGIDEIDYWTQDEDIDEGLFYVTTKDLQALGCACLWISSKLEDRDPCRQDDLAYISDHCFSTQKLRRIEARVTKALQFQLQRVNPSHFVPFFLRASQTDHPPSHLLEHVLSYILELARTCFSLSYTQPSLLTAAALYLARATLGLQQQPSMQQHCYWTTTLAFYTGHTVGDMEETIVTLYRLHIQAEDTAREIFRKYSSHKRLHASLRTVRLPDELGLSEQSVMQLTEA